MNRDILLPALLIAFYLIGGAVGAVLMHGLCADQHDTHAAAPVALMRAA